MENAKVKRKPRLTRVVFRKHKVDGGIIAFFPEITVNYGNIMSYERVGQHGEASYRYYLECTVKATADEYNGLLNELRSIYTDGLRVLTWVNHRVLSKSWKRATEFGSA
jgi:hypothetical protein